MFFDGFAGHQKAAQRRSAVSPIPSSNAICPMLLPLRWINRTVSALYSAETVRRFPFLSFSTAHSYRAYFRAFRSVHQTGASPDLKTDYGEGHRLLTPSFLTIRRAERLSLTRQELSRRLGQFCFSQQPHHRAALFAVVVWVRGGNSPLALNF